MPSREEQREQTRRAILEALTEVIIEHGALEFSIQQVADRAGVTHRTVYNHFPTREALNDAFGVFVDEQLETAFGSGRAPDEGVAATDLHTLVSETYETFERLGKYLHASAMLMLAVGEQAQVTRERSERFTSLLETDLNMDASSARMGAAALRMFVSSTGWHLLTQQLGLSPEEAKYTAEWATRALLAEMTRGNHPQGEEEEDDDD